jgi:hypothetical protein
MKEELKAMGQYLLGFIVVGVMVFGVLAVLLSWFPAPSKSSTTYTLEKGQRLECVVKDAH